MVETTQTKPSTGTGLVNQVENKLLGNQTGFQQQPLLTQQPLLSQGVQQQPLLSQGTGLQNPLQAPPRQQGVMGTGLTGASTVGATPLSTATTGMTPNQPHQGFVGKVKDALTGHHSTTGVQQTGLQQGYPQQTGLQQTGYTSGTTGLQQGYPQQTGFQQTGTLLSQGTGFQQQQPLLNQGLAQSTVTSSSSSWTSGSQTGFVDQRLSGTTQPVLNRGSFVENVATHITTERPVLERVEKIVHKDVIEKPHILEQHEKELIEVHEQPIEKRIIHPTQEFHVREDNLYETSGRDVADLERSRIIEQMRLQDMNRRVDVQEHQDLRVTQQAPTIQMQQELHKEIIQKPIVTEIHEQPIVEIHEQNIHKTIYERPIVNVIREAPIVESTITSSQPLSGLEATITRGMHTMNLNTQPVQQPVVVQQPVIVQQPIVQQPVIGTTLVEKSLTDASPHLTTNSGINPLVTRK